MARVKVKNRYSDKIRMLNDRDIVRINDFAEYAAIKRMLNTAEKGLCMGNSLGFNIFALSTKGKKPREIEKIGDHTIFEF